MVNNNREIAEVFVSPGMLNHQGMHITPVIGDKRPCWLTPSNISIGCQSCLPSWGWHEVRIFTIEPV